MFYILCRISPLQIPPADAFHKHDFLNTVLAMLDPKCMPFWFYLCLSKQPEATNCYSSITMHVSSIVCLLRPGIFLPQLCPDNVNPLLIFKFYSFLYIGVLLR